MLSAVCRRVAPNAWNALRPRAANAVRNSSHGHGQAGTVPGENLPFDINNKYKLTALFAVFFGSGLAIPFLAVRHQILKQ